MVGLHWQSIKYNSIKFIMIYDLYYTVLTLLTCILIRRSTPSKQLQHSSFLCAKRSHTMQFNVPQARIEETIQDLCVGISKRMFFLMFGQCERFLRFHQVTESIGEGKPRNRWSVGLALASGQHCQWYFFMRKLLHQKNNMGTMVDNVHLLIDHVQILDLRSGHCSTDFCWSTREKTWKNTRCKIRMRRSAEPLAVSPL